MKYGTFDDQHGEYVIERPDTPRPWSNYIGSADFGGVVTNNAAGYTFYKSAAQGRLTRYQFNSSAAELCGRYVYLRDEDDGEYWSASWLSVAKPLEAYRSECRHAPGRTTICSEYKGIRTTLTFFVPLGATYEVWQLSVENLRESEARLKIFPFVEPQCNWSAEDDNFNLQYNQYIATTTSPVPGIINIASNRNMPEDPENFTNKDQQRHTFFGVVGAEVSGFDGDLEVFQGRHGSIARPEAVCKGGCSNSEASGDMPCGAFELSATLAAGESTQCACVFGVGRAEEAGETARAAVSSSEQRTELLDRIREYWQQRVSVLKVHTPDPLFDSMVNLWAPFNSLMTFYWSRTASLVYAGERDGLGYRDTVQDIVAAASLVTDEAKERLELMITGQYANGGCKPVVQPFHHRPGHEEEPEAYRSDDALWLFNAIPTYVNETGDVDFYHKVLPYADTGEGTVLEHLRKAIEFSLERSGTHGLPCGLHADWNDCIRLGEKGESVFVAFQLRLGMKENGGIFNHTQGWGVLALCQLGMGDRAYEYMMNVLPAAFNDKADLREVEPYAVCQSTHSSFSPRYGAGRLSWLSGSATWNYAAMTTGILGIRPTEEGLEINPCIPSAWKGFTATRQFRGAEIQIEVQNPNGHQSGVKRMMVDGKELEGCVLPAPASGATVSVVVEL